MKKLLFIALASAFIMSCSTSQSVKTSDTPEVITTKPFDSGTEIKINFTPGKSFNHPLIAFWIEDMNGNYIQTVYASKSITTGIFKYGVYEKGEWKPGERRRPASLPYWLHKLGKITTDGYFLPSPENPLPDAYTGATPQSSFVVKFVVPSNLKQFKLFMEINQPWDWNNFWHNNKFPGDAEYATSAQPALVYSTDIHTGAKGAKFFLKPIGHSHYSGASGELFSDISTLTTALNIASDIWVEVE
jgi:hypothetical protein